VVAFHAIYFLPSFAFPCDKAAGGGPPEIFLSADKGKYL